MPPQAQNKHELPPTAGLPLNFSDYARKPALPLAAGLEQWPGLPEAIFTCSGTAALVDATVHRLRAQGIVTHHQPHLLAVG